MDLLTSIIVVVVFLVLMQVVFSEAFFKWIARGIERIHARVDKRIPVGSYRFDSEIGIAAESASA